MVSVAHGAVLDVWVHSHRAILDFIAADDFTVIVPNSDLSRFLAVTDARFEVLSEDGFVLEIASQLRERLGSKSLRYGWYLQQFIKLAAVERFASHANVVLWDADTIPLKAITFFKNDGRPTYFLGTEHHLPYFGVIEKTLGIDRYFSQSFVAQSFPVLASHAQLFFRYIEQRSGCPWHEAFLGAIDFDQESGFSEYETLGTFVRYFFPNEIAFQEELWLRNGWLLFPSPAAAMRASGRLLWSQKYAFCSFEAWQKPQPGCQSRLGALYWRALRTLRQIGNGVLKDLVHR